MRLGPRRGGSSGSWPPRSRSSRSPSRWERGATTPDLDVLRLVAEATEKPLSYFVAGETDQAAAPSADATIRKLEEAAERLNAQADRIAGLLDDVRAELARLR